MTPNRSRPGDGARGAAMVDGLASLNIDDTANPGRAKAPRTAWALRELVRAGARGVSTRDNPAPRWSAYVHRLRGEGVVVETEMEPHAGAYPGRHARYRLRSRVRIEGCAP